MSAKHFIYKPVIEFTADEKKSGKACKVCYAGLLV
jgi:hypothetical protein